MERPDKVQYYRSLWVQGTLRPWQLLLVRIRKIYEENPGNWNYGIGRILLTLEQRGVSASRSTVRRAMKKGGLLKAPARRPQSLTKADAAAVPNQKWLTDITQVPCADGKLYIATVLDCYNSEIVGLSMDDNMRKKLCIRAFEGSCRARDARGMILHRTGAASSPARISGEVLPSMTPCKL